MSTARVAPGLGSFLLGYSHGLDSPFMSGRWSVFAAVLPICKSTLERVKQMISNSLFQLEISQGGELDVEGGPLAATLGFVKIRSALRTEPKTFFAAEGVHRQRHDRLFGNRLTKVELLAVKENQTHFLGAQLDLLVV
jgi:hypothetical protein